jgi:hypothetical protein
MPSRVQNSLNVAMFAVALSTTAGFAEASTKITDTAIQVARPQLLAKRGRLEATKSLALKRIDALAEYKAGWNGADSVEPNPDAIRDAKLFVEQLFALGEIYSPTINLANDGEINLYWDTPSARIDLGFYGTGTYSYFAEEKDGQEHIEDDLVVAAKPSDLFMSLISKA